ncbi:MAG: 6-phosphogluconolactonase [Candidatus Glassbacteria bacterium RIFCSPLOWO2_12_FULL_58_11]|uniref:6-phosphogluconolactonase n=1 Tax=Candidatus Glassbacteria bacterium RIFCSPLOWO2_12_FULL_58_11 TaxID=1817867 RepID=A0A1F5YLM0_9BACT|nr:MAG: 6-phosphogluconolactonase [Candidatus Glassbacteria bacterium RIFCSPLOWO2_12_FULL_58_11]
MKPQVQVFEDVEELSRAAAEFVTRRAVEVCRAGGAFRVALSGGSTPKKLYQLLAGEPWRGSFPWEKSHFFLGDERFVAQEHPESNFGMARQALLDKVPLPAGNVHPLDSAAVSVEEAARRYEEELRKVFERGGKDRGSKPAGDFPRFDLVLLGLGPDGHTASLFPGNPVLEERRRWAAAVEAPPGYPTRERVSLTLPVINAAAYVLFLAAGREKSPIVKAILETPEKARSLYPAALVEPSAGELFWFLDRQARI